MKFTIDECLAKLPLEANEKWPDGVWDIEPHSDGEISMVFFAPEKTDHQTSHEQNEYYFIARGSGTLVIDGEPKRAETGDAFFVRANSSHHFENFTDDFATWAVFF